MPRVLIIGRGPLPSPALRHVGFAQLRTRHFAQALSSAGCDVDLLTIEDDLAPGLLDEARRRASQADAVVSAGPHRPGALAVAAAGDRPLWVDVPGDPLAELQALLRAPGPPISAERVAAAQAATHAVLARADALSVISNRQRLATFGRLSAMGRDLLEPVRCATIPIAWDLPLPRRPTRALPAEGPVRLALCGAFAPWLNDETLSAALSLAFAQEPRLELHVTGGAVHGHYTAGWERFTRWAARHPERVHLHGWVPHADLEQILGDCHLGLSLDRPGAEPQLGGRTRVWLYAWMGLQVAASPTCEQVSEMVNNGLVHSIFGDPNQVSEQLLRVVRQRPSVPDAHPIVAPRYSPEAITAPLVQWALSPIRAAPGPGVEALLAAQVETLQAQLSAVHHSPTWRILSRLHRLAGGSSS